MTVFEQSIEIQASVATVELCFTDLDLMHRWLNPMLRCQPIGEWSTKIGSRSRFFIDLPFIKPELISIITERESGLIVWKFEGFFQGKDRWQCREENNVTCLVNRFEFEIPNPLIDWGFNLFAVRWTKKDMQAQLQRLKQVAESVNSYQ